ncbi:hypothetical protein [Haloarchaeobius litoreus]|uniref:PH domain-containing protein n=1 Tax=Haloarchaeobius litoreus TaxID=755306 RepID=A0ABD6DKD6_9EURY|nr:hypothetical protein [Haloarchaeobius litoreus]
MSDAYEDYTEGRKRTKWDAVADVVVGYKRYIAGALLVLLIAGNLGWIDLPRVTFAHWFVALALAAGATIGSSAVLYELQDYLDDRRIRLSLAPVNSGVHDVIKVPRKTFSKFRVVGTKFPDRRLITGGKVLVARAIDFDNQVIVPAQEFDDDKYPDDLDLIGDDADGAKIAQYREALLEDARERQRITVDEEVIRESAMGDAVDMFSKALRDVRDGDINLQQMDDQQVAVQAEQLIQDAAQASVDDADGGDE